MDKSKKDKNGTTIVLGANISLAKIFTTKKVNIKSGVKIENPRDITIKSADGQRYKLDFSGISFNDYEDAWNGARGKTVTYDNIDLYGTAALTPIRNAGEYVIKDVNFEGSQMIYSSRSVTTVNFEGTNHLATVNSYNNPVGGGPEEPLRNDGAKNNSQQVIQLNLAGSSVNFKPGSNTTMTTVSGNVLQLPNNTSVTVDTGATVILEPHSGKKGDQIEYNATFDADKKKLTAAHGILAEGATITVQPKASLTINANQDESKSEQYASGGILSRNSKIIVGEGATLAINSNGRLSNEDLTSINLAGGFGLVALDGSSSITVGNGGTFSVNATNAGDYNKSLVGINGAGTVTLAPHSTFQVSGDGNGAVTGIQLSKKGGSFTATRPEKFNVDLSGNTNPDKKLITNGTIDFNLVKERLSGEGANADYSGGMKNIQVQYNAQGQPTVSAIEGTTIANENAVTNAIKNTSADNLYFTMAGPDVKIVEGTPSLSYNKETLTGRVSVSEDNISHKISNQNVYISVQIVKSNGQTIDVPMAVPNPYHKETMQFQAITDANGNFTVDLSKVADQIADGDSIKITAIKDFVEDSTTLPVTSIKKQPQSQTNPAVPVTTPLPTTKGTLPADPAKGISNFADLPQPAKVTYRDGAQDKINNATPGAPVMIPVLITYPDGSTLDSEIPVEVSEPSQENPTPVKTPLTVNQGGELPNPESGISNASQMPAGTTYAWKDGGPKTDTAGSKTGTVIVTFPAKPGETAKTTEVQVPIEVSQAEPAPIKTPLTVNQGGELPNAKSGISNASQMPEGTTYAWKDGGPKTDTAGSKTGTVIVTFPAKPGEPAKTVEVPVTIEVSQAEPAAGDITTVKKGHVLTPEDAKNAIGNVADMPAGTKYTWTQVPDVNTPGEKTGVVTVTMPGKDPVPVTVKVTVSNQDSGNQISVTKDHVMTDDDAKQALLKGGNKLPNDADVHWVDKVDTSNVGTPTGQMRVQIPGQPDQIINVPVTVTLGQAGDAKNPAITLVGTDGVTPEVITTIKDAVKKANPSLNDPGANVKVGPDGTTTATFPDGSQKVFKPNLTIAEKPELTPVGNPTALTPDERTKVADAIQKANPDLTNITVKPDGTATATAPGSEGQAGKQVDFSAADTVTDGLAKDAKYPDLTPVKDPADLKPADLQKVKDAIEAANPTFTGPNAKVEVGANKDGQPIITATFPDGSQKEYPLDQAVAKKPELTPVGNTKNLMPAEKAAVAQKVKDANPDLIKPNGNVEVADDGTVTVTFPNGTKLPIPGTETVEEGQASHANNPNLTPVKDPADLKPADLQKVNDAIEAANPTTFTGPNAKVEVGTNKDGQPIITATFPDGSQKEYPLNQAVAKKTDADRNAPRAKDVTVQVGKTPVPEDAIANAGDLPTGTKFEWKNQPDTTTPGEITAVVVVTYPDGSTEEVAVKITVIKKATAADQLTPKVMEVTAKPDQLPDPSAAVSNLKELPKGTTITWDDPAGSLEKIRQAAPGTTVEVPATVTYPDGSVDHIMIPITLPAAKPEAGAITTTPGQLPDLAEGITNLGDLPAGTVVKWQNAKEAQMMLDQAQPGSTIQLSAEVTYADGTHELVMINVRVQTDATMMIKRGAEDDATMTEASEMRAKTAEANGAAKAATGAIAAPAAPTAKAKQGTLPQTGEQQNRGSLIGLVGLGLLTLIGLGRKKRNEKED